MTRSGTARHNGEYFRLLHAIVFAIAMLSIFLHGPLAQADIVIPSNDRLIVADIDLERPRQTRTTKTKRPPRRLRFRHIAAISIECSITQEKYYECQNRQ